MSVEALMTLTATVVDRGEVVLPDGDIGTQVLSVREVACYVERASELELRDNQLISIAYWRVYLPITEAMTAGDSLTVTLGPDTYTLELESNAVPIWNARMAYTSHREARAREVT